MPTRWFDAHLDLAYLAETGRDLHAPLAACRGRHRPPSITLPSLAQGNITHALATIFAEPAPILTVPTTDPGPWTYTPADPASAHRAGMRQLKLYHAWRDAGIIHLLPLPSGEREEVRGAACSGFGPQVSGLKTQDSGRTSPLSLGLLMESADPITSPDELPLWADAGVIAIGLTWAAGSRYAAGNSADPASGPTGLTPMGRDLIARMDDFGVLHDLSHLAQRATDDLLALTPAPVIASHSNCRALMGDPDSVRNQRHLADATIAEIARRGGVIGINLFSPFLRPGIAPEAKDRATIDDIIAHIEHACEVVGDRRHIALGSDADGGFGADRLPHGIDTPSDYSKIADALAARNWPDEDIEAFAFTNWARCLGVNDPGAMV